MDVLSAVAATDDDDDDDDDEVDVAATPAPTPPTDDTGCGGVVDEANVVACDTNDADKPPTDGDLGTSSTALKDAAELPYSKLTKFKLCVDEFEDSSASVAVVMMVVAAATETVDLIGVFARFA